MKDRGRQGDKEKKMPNFPGAKTYPLLTDRTPMIDAGTFTKGREPSIPRGGTVEDYNVKLRGAGVRLDLIPDRPYP